MSPLRFPEGFLWGSATSAHQVEGQNTNNQWWAWEQQPGHIWNNDVSGDACGWWRDARPDLDRAAALGQNAHRMSVEWSRIEPRDGEFDKGAIRRYREIVEQMLERGLKPMITLHHFTHPLWIEARGGWLHPDTPRRFGRYVRYVVTELRDLCDLWCTINEPLIYAGMSYQLGRWPPGWRNPRAALKVAAAMLRGHAIASDVIHSVHPALRVGLVHNLRIVEPATPRTLDVFPAWLIDYLSSGAFLWSLATGRLMPPFGNGLRELPGLRDSCDFLGLNYYTRDVVAFDWRARGLVRFDIPVGLPFSDIGGNGRSYGEIYAHGAYRALHRLAGFKKPIYITETGLPDEDDDQRPQFLLSHLAAVHKAISEGIDVRGVFHWSLLDNFEWADGWGLRFGLYAFDHRTGERRLRPSGALYAVIARANAIPDLESHHHYGGPI
jgi:beta-glucosidase